MKQSANKYRYINFCNLCEKYRILNLDHWHYALYISTYVSPAMITTVMRCNNSSAMVLQTGEHCCNLSNIFHLARVILTCSCPEPGLQNVTQQELCASEIAAFCILTEIVSFCILTEMAGFCILTLVTYLYCDYNNICNNNPHILQYNTTQYSDLYNTRFVWI